MTHNTRDVKDCWCHKEGIRHDDSHVIKPIKPIISPEVKNIEQKFTKEYFVNALGEAVREMHKWDNIFLSEEKAREWMASAYDTIVEQNHHQLQKAREEERERIYTAVDDVASVVLVAEIKTGDKDEILGMLRSITL